MFAIQTNDKFLAVRYFLYPDEVFDTAITGKPKLWKTQEEADMHLSRAIAYFKEELARANKIVVDAKCLAIKADKRIIKLKAELDMLVERPYKDVHKEINRKQKELIKREEETIRMRDFVKQYTRSAKKFQLLLAANYNVVAIDTVAV